MTTTIMELQIFFERMKRSHCDGISGVMRFETGKPGPVVGITACTHGNEPSGLAAIASLLREIETSGLLRGTLYCIVNNIRATEAYFSASTPEEKAKTRYTEVNMNRLPDDMPERRNDTRYEIVRAQELYPLWRQFDVGFDIHSTSQDSPPMILSGGGTFHAALVRGFPISTVLSNIDVVQIGLPAFGFYGGAGSGIPVFEIEAGGHEQPESFDRAAMCAKILLQNLGMLSGDAPAPVSEYLEYYIDGSVVLPDNSYRVTRVFENFEYVPQGRVLARGSGPDILMPFDGHTFFCASAGKSVGTNEEALFLSRPVRSLATL